jgi:hypothetical protein
MLSFSIAIILKLTINISKFITKRMAIYTMPAGSN